MLNSVSLSVCRGRYHLHVPWAIESESRVLAGVHILNDLFTRFRVRSNDLFATLAHLFNVFLLVLSG